MLVDLKSVSQKLNKGNITKFYIFSTLKRLKPHFTATLLAISTPKRYLEHYLVIIPSDIIWNVKLHTLKVLDPL